ncbi:MAG: NAD-dependent deacylase [Candidatus Neomarinimicrobiota bacterium]
MKISLNHYNKIIFFTGAGMSAESGVPTYRGKGGIWNEYKWEEYACQNAFNKNPEFVLNFHQLRRVEALNCNPHHGHTIISNIEYLKRNTFIITQNIDGMHQRANSKNVIELHGSLWRLRCEKEGIVIEDKMEGQFSKTICDCGEWLRPDIIWFEDMLKEDIIAKANQKIIESDLFISIGTSGMVWPAASYPSLAKSSGSFCIEINPEETELSKLYDHVIRLSAADALNQLFN